MATDLPTAIDITAAALRREVCAGMKRSPLLTLGIGAAGGYVLGAGLPAGAARFLLGAATRTAIVNLLATAAREARDRDPRGTMS